MTHTMQAHDVAQRFWHDANSHPIASSNIGAAVSHTFGELRTGLLPWVGAEGYRALLDRAIGEVERTHPALAGLVFLGSDDPVSAPVTADEVEAATREVEAVTVGLVGALIDALGRSVGHDLAVRLVGRIAGQVVERKQSSPIRSARHAHHAE